MGKLWLLGFALTAWSCQPRAPDAPKKPPVATAGSAIDASCRVTVCMAGALRREDGGNPALGRLCDELPSALPGGCVGDKCYRMFSMFESEPAYSALHNALDKNGDGRVDGADPACEVNLLGYSWGGVNAAGLAKRLVTDETVSAERKGIEKLIVIDGYAPTAGGRIDVSGNVRLAWHYRHSKAPAADCSTHAPMGPYFGLPFRCVEGSVCREFDYSLAPTVMFESARGQARGQARGRESGQSVGHCTIVRVATPAILVNLLTGEDAPSAPPKIE